MNTITAIPAFKDNYIWAIHSPDGLEIIVVDPGDATPVLDYLQKNNLKLHAILLTHHHWDHSGGIPGLLEQYNNIPVYGPAHEKVKIEGLSHPVSENAEINFPSFGLTLKCLDIPGHTAGHIAFVGPKLLFCGDTLFACGCGRIFEGTPSQMLRSLTKMKELPKDTLIYCGHEYTLANIAFAQTVDPHNQLLEEKRLKILKARQENQPSLPVSLASELETNPFLRCDNQAIITAVQKHADLSGEQDPVTIFAHLRQWKDHFS